MDGVTRRKVNPSRGGCSEKGEQGLQRERAGAREGRVLGVAGHSTKSEQGTRNDPTGKRGAQKTTFMLSLQFILKAKEVAPGGF